MEKRISAHLKALQMGQEALYKNMAVFPIFAETEDGSRYLSLNEAMGTILIEITEVSESGDVPNLKVINQAEIAILILAGEELVGAKQDRIVNATFMIDGGHSVTIPVSCVEQGRWRYRSKEFSSENRMCSPVLRNVVHQDVMFSIREGRGLRANQGRVWDSLSAKSIRMNVRSETGPCPKSMNLIINKSVTIPKSFPYQKIKRG